jgi:phytoene dehydrogenase-like protein
VRVIIIGAGHNGLAAAFYLARAGLKPLVLERRPVVGGGAITAEIHPGFQCPALSHEVLLHRRVARDMRLETHGLELLQAPTQLCALEPDGPPLVVQTDLAAAVESIGRFSPPDAEAYAAFRRTVDRVAAVLTAPLGAAPPDIDHPTGADLWPLLRMGWQVRLLGRRDAYRLLRWLPMSVADFTQEWFEHDLLRAAVAAPGVSGTMLGPRSAGSTLVLLLREAHRHLAGGRSLHVRGGPGALTRAMAAAATAAGAEIRTEAAVERILVDEDRVTGVVVDGRELPARLILAAVDPKTALLRLVGAPALSPTTALRIRNYRSEGTVAKVNLALSALPAFRHVHDPAHLSGRLHIGPGLDSLERAFDHAKYGEVSAEPWLDVTIPSILDPSLAPHGAHVMSIYVHYAPFMLRQGTWTACTGALLDRVLTLLDSYAPGFRALVVAAQMITPAALEAEYGFAGGHIFHGELAPDQLFTFRPLPGYARYAGPVRGLFFCSAGTHPGGFLTGASGRLAAAVVRRAAGELRAR